jgi:hypothetical protein
MVALIELETLHSSPADDGPHLILLRQASNIGAQRDLEGSQNNIH